MKVAILAVGRMKSGPEKELADRYFERFSKSGPAIGLEFAGVSEFPESRSQNVDERRRDEAMRMQGQMIAGSKVILLDERGKNFSSQEFADKIATFRDGGQRALTFAIGGADGHDASTREVAALSLSFGALTWPHQLVRIMLAEQLYRSATILSGHPYHRA
ncbi:23S rRNA (pseudouridine(1915)-N(3))-methyltransferase RlmH [Mesorhizobium sp. NBSH29]|uniref:23S rRNA (pseudouridine(1915)-N(3))-methyltransferase RlmH n=1 Tax=Mesorhizobium sp. NBSH29 TaxID=2654249 RepID=UPI0018967FAF|nr:23S rRNA (pseudouridine(1915)-N(3))-methyltransferase RlmH [Mesorhizobium sp. NBSH29]QPC85905.1 23S rRNA (pseudouridine(1915)-N(3))-methyltransferase RlmH [Mesorhizobium sp. NBSH29]